MENAKRNKSSKHNINLGFQDRWQPHSIEPKALKLVYNYRSASPKRRNTPIRIPMNIWDKKRQEIKEEYHSKYIEYVNLINNYKSRIPKITLDLNDNKISWKDAFNILLNIVEDGYILDKFEDFCKLNKKSSSAINKQSDYISALQSFFNDIEEIEYSRLKWSHILHAKHIRRIETLLREKSNVKNSTKNSYLGALNYASGVNPNTSNKPFEDKFESDVEVNEEKHLYKEELQKGISKIGVNKQWLEAYLFWLLSFSLRGLDGADLCLMNESWLVNEKGNSAKGFKHYLPNYKTLINKDADKEIKWAENTPQQIKDLHKPKEIFGNKKVYLIGYRAKGKNTKKIGIKILFNHYPTMIIHRLLKYMIHTNRPHLVSKGTDPLKLYNIDYYSDKGKRQWKTLMGVYTKQLQKMMGSNANIKNTRHTFTTALSQILGSQTDTMLSTSLGHRTKSTLKYYVAQDQTKLDIYHTEVVKSFKINKVLALVIDWANRKGMIRIDGVAPTVNSFELEALNIPLSYWSPEKEYEYQRLIKAQDVKEVIGFDEDDKEIFKDAVYSPRLKELIKERNLSISEKKIKRTSINYNRETGQTETTFK